MRPLSGFASIFVCKEKVGKPQEAANSKIGKECISEFGSDGALPQCTAVGLLRLFILVVFFCISLVF